MVGKVFSAYAQGHGFNPQDPLSYGMVTCTPSVGVQAEAGGIPRAQWPDSLAYLVTPTQ